MNSKRARLLRKLALKMGYRETKYAIGLQPEFNITGKTFTFQGKEIMPGRRVLVGKPTKLQKNCTRYIYKKLKEV